MMVTDDSGAPGGIETPTPGLVFLPNRITKNSMENKGQVPSEGLLFPAHIIVET